MVRSSLGSLLVLATLSLSAAEFQFDATGVTAFVTPSATTYWTCACIGSLSGTALIASYQAIVTDTDGDGVVRWELGSKMKTRGLWTMVDGTAGTITTRRRSDGSLEEPLAFPSKAFLRDENGAFSRFVVNDVAVLPSDRMVLFWARPGVGAWSGVVSNGGSRDELPQAGSRLMFDVRTMTPVAGSPSTPSGLQNGDFLVVTDHDADFWTGGLVNPYLGEAGGGGVIVYATVAGSEDAGKMTITLGRTEGTDGAVSVHYATSDDTARAGIHYQASSGTVVFEAGRILRSFDVPLIDDQINANSARFRVTLSEPSGATIASPPFLVSIPDNDSTPIVSVEQKAVNEAGSGPREATLKVSLSHTAPQPVSARWTSSDFFTGAVRETGTVQFGVGENEKTILLHFLANEVWEGDRRLRVVLTEVVNATALGEGRLIIIEDDPKPVMTMDDLTVSEAAGTADVTIRLSAPLTAGVLFYCGTEDGTAEAPGDYTAKFAEVVIPAGSTSVTFSVPLRDDSVIEATETFRIVLEEGFNGPGPMIATVTILDEDDQPDPSVTIEQVTSGERDGGAREVPVNVALSAPAPRPVTLEWKAYDLTTGATIDTGVLQFGIGERSKPLSVTCAADDLWGPDQQIAVVITKATNATATAEGRITLVEDEPVPVMTVRGAVVREGDGQAVVRIELSGAARNPIPGSFQITGGTATRGQDFVRGSSDFVIAAGTTLLTIEVRIVNDTVSEETESFTVAVEATVGAPAPLTATVTILDDDAPGRRRSMRH